MKLRFLILVILIISGVYFTAPGVNTGVDVWGNSEVVKASEANETSDSSIPVTIPQDVSFEKCTKIFAINKEKLFYLTLGAVTANKFTVEEIQTTNGYIIFSAANNKYLASVAGIDTGNSILKITPCNNIYYFPPGVVINMFKYIDLNINTDIKG